jgi:hypothetical protein
MSEGTGGSRGIEVAVDDGGGGIAGASALISTRGKGTGVTVSRAGAGGRAGPGAKPGAGAGGGALLPMGTVAACGFADALTPATISFFAFTAGAAVTGLLGLVVGFVAETLIVLGRFTDSVPVVDPLPRSFFAMCTIMQRDSENWQFAELIASV